MSVTAPSLTTASKATSQSEDVRAKPTKQLSHVFLGAMLIYLVLAPFTQLIQIISLPLHVKIGFSEPAILDPEFGWHRAYELASAYSDLTHLFTGVIFVAGSVLHKSWCIPFGYYTCAASSFVMLAMRIRWSLLETNGFGVLGDYSEAFAHGYAYACILFGWCGMYYLWSERHIYDSLTIAGTQTKKAIRQHGCIEMKTSVTPEKHLSYVILGAFTALLIMGPFTQLIQIVSLPLHVKLGLSEHIILQPEYGWFKAEELAIAWADQTYLFAGTLFIAGALLGKSWCLPFGLYSTSCWSIILLMARIRWALLEATGFGVVSESQRAAFYGYAYIYILSGWYMMYYLWCNHRIYDKVHVE